MHSRNSIGTIKLLVMLERVRKIKMWGFCIQEFFDSLNYPNYMLRSLADNKGKEKGS